MAKGKGSTPFIISAELAERLSYYGFSTILYIYLTTAFGQGEKTATIWTHVFLFASYAMTLPGAILADVYWGRYPTILRFGILYVIGHGILAYSPTPMGFLLGCGLIALGSGALKPNVASLLGDQVPEEEGGNYERIFSNFYLAVNLGATLSFLTAEYFLIRFGPEVAFGIPGVAMLIALIIFWSGRKRYRHAPVTPWREYRHQLLGDGRGKKLLNIAVVYLFLAVFWSLFDQSASTLIGIAKQLQRTFTLFGTEITLLPTQFRAINSVFILGIVPAFTLVLYPFLRRTIGLGYRRKLLYGMVLAVLSFIVVGAAQEQIAAGLRPSAWYIVICYAILTAAEVLISVTALEMAYALATKATRSTVGSFYALSVAAGNLLTALITTVLTLPGMSVSKANYIWLFMGLMLTATVLFAFVGKRLLAASEA